MDVNKIMFQLFISIKALYEAIMKHKENVHISYHGDSHLLITINWFVCVFSLVKMISIKKNIRVYIIFIIYVKYYVLANTYLSLEYCLGNRNNNINRY